MLINVKTSQFKTQYKSASKTAKITVFDPVICKTPDVLLQNKLLVTFIYFHFIYFATFMPLWLCVGLLIAHYTTVIMLEARSKRGKENDLYFQVTGDMWLTLN